VNIFQQNHFQDLVSSSAPTAAAAKATEKMSKEAFKYYSQAQSDYKPPLIANENAFLGDVYSRYNIPTRP